MPQRLQRKRTPGWKKPDGAVCVTRPGPWENPFVFAPDRPLALRRRLLQQGACRTAEEAIAKFRAYAVERAKQEPGWLEPLRGKDLLCFCREGAPCHGDVLLELANA